MEIDLIKELSKTIPIELAGELIGEYSEIKKAFIRSDFEAIGHHSTKFYETILQTLEYIYIGSYSQRVKIDQLIASLEKSPRERYPESIRIIIPRVCKALITLRSERIEHKSRDITPKHIDSALIIALCDWIIAEFLRLYHTSDESMIQGIISEITHKKLPVMEEFEDGGIAFHMNGISASDKILASLYCARERLRPAEIARRTRIKHISTVIKALEKLNSNGSIDKNADGVMINSKGIQYVENLISSISAS